MNKQVKRVGFTGTQQGMTVTQKAKLREVLEAVKEDFQLYFQHGDCIGADSEAHDIVKAIGDAWVAIHPPDNPSKRAYRKANLFHQPMPYLVRNHAIVECCDILIATPSGHTEKVRSGTWATIRFARKLCKPVTIIFPDGSVEAAEAIH